LVLVLTSVAFGGFVFYAAAVVPIGSRVVGVTTQGFVTRQVTVVLNSISLAAVMVWGWELWASRRVRTRHRMRWYAIAITLVAVCTGIQFLLHVRLNRLLDPQELSVSDTVLFYGWHRIYLWCSTVQFCAWLVVLRGVMAEMRDGVIGGKDGR